MPYQTLLGVTGSGKTFTIVCLTSNKPTLVLNHNKTLAAQLYNEFKLLPQQCCRNIMYLTTITTNPKHTFRARPIYRKDLSINQEIEKLRLAATSSYFRTKDVIVVSSVSLSMVSTPTIQ